MHEAVWAAVEAGGNARHDCPSVRRRVLVVDDHPDTVALYVEILQAAGFEVEGTTSPNRALNIALTTHPDVLIADIAMPEMDGSELATLVRSYSTTRDIRVVAVSAHAFDFSRYVLPRGGWDACLRKPIDPSMLVHTVRTVLGDERSGTYLAIPEEEPPSTDRNGSTDD